MQQAVRTILLGLNPDWIKKQGDFWVEMPINFLTAAIWFLRKYKKGQFCTLPRAVELVQLSYDKLFSILRSEPEVEILISPFVKAYLKVLLLSTKSGPKQMEFWLLIKNMSSQNSILYIIQIQYLTHRKGDSLLQLLYNKAF